jgi:hypothetical protein
MIFIASVLEPYLTADAVAWRPPIPCIVIAEDKDKAIESVKRKFWVRVPEIEKRLLAKYPDWNKEHYYEVTMAPLPEEFSGAESVFMVIANMRRPIRFHC